MKHTGVASANLESFRRLGHRLVDSSLESAHVVGIRDHCTDGIHSADLRSGLCNTNRSRPFATSKGDTTTQPATCARRLMWWGAKIRFRGGPIKSYTGKNLRRRRRSGDSRRHAITRLSWAIPFAHILPRLQYLHKMFDFEELRCRLAGKSPNDEK